LSHHILVAENIKKRYGKRTILNNVSIHVEYGDIYGLVGRNGSGKTTLLRIITGLVPDFGGTVSLARTHGRESQFAAVISDPSLFLNMSAFENMKEQAHLLGLRDDLPIAQTLELVGLAGRSHRPVRDYSLGMTQRLRLAVALLQKPDLLVLDEPMNGLDPDGIVDLRELLLRLSKSNVTILISSHILSELEQIATRLAILHDGRIAIEVATRQALRDGISLEGLYMQYTRGSKPND
jgi:ABC-type multidrug transport system ATPase subunit